MQPQAVACNALRATISYKLVTCSTTFQVEEQWTLLRELLSGIASRRRRAQSSFLCPAIREKRIRRVERHLLHVFARPHVASMTREAVMTGVDYVRPRALRLAPLPAFEALFGRTPLKNNIENKLRCRVFQKHFSATQWSASLQNSGWFDLIPVHRRGTQQNLLTFLVIDSLQQRVPQTLLTDTVHFFKNAVLPIAKALERISNRHRNLLKRKPFNYGAAHESAWMLCLVAVSLVQK